MEKDFKIGVHGIRVYARTVLVFAERAGVYPPETFVKSATSSAKIAPE
jgi:hypothetical protein